MVSLVFYDEWTAGRTWMMAGGGAAVVVTVTAEATSISAPRKKACKFKVGF